MAAARSGAPEVGYGRRPIDHQSQSATSPPARQPHRLPPPRLLTQPLIINQLSHALLYISVE